MPILYKLSKDTRTQKDGTTPFNSKTYNKWFAKAIHTATIESREIAEKIAYSASATVADTLAVINALVKVMSDSLKEGYTVKLDSFGSWKIGIKSTAADSVDAFSASRNIVGSRCNFQPEYTIDSATGKKSVKMLSECKIQEAPKNSVV